MRFLLAVVAATVVISLTDWLFFGVLFQKRYLRTPEVFRAMPEGKRIGISMLFAAIGSAAFIGLASHLHMDSMHDVATLVFHVWLAASLPQTVVNTLYVRYDPILVVSHSLGWLARVTAAGAAFWFVLGH